MGSSLKYTESPSRGTWGSPWSPFIALPSFLKGATYHDNMEQADSVARAVVGIKVPAASCGFTGTTPGEDVMARLIQELLLLTCMGGLVAGVTYAVTLLH